jgi:hypothetical protein
LKATQPGVSVRALFAKYKIESARNYILRSRVGLNKIRAAGSCVLPGHGDPMCGNGGGSVKSDDGEALPTNKIEYFSWYAYSDEPASPGKAYTNLAMDRNLTFLKQVWEQKGVLGMLLLQESQWAGAPHDTGGRVDPQNFIFGKGGLARGSAGRGAKGCF